MLQQHHHLSEQPMELPPGFRFHPTDEELITHYLARKVSDADFAACAIGDADLNKCEPWDLPLRAKMGEKEWYFFCLKDRKYPTGLRTNRATQSGYWKATGKDKEIYRGKHLVGMKKTLVFYGGRAPKGEKTNWVMHEFRLDGNYSAYALPKASKNNEWVICRVFKKSAGGNKAVGMVRVVGSSAAGDHQLGSSLLPPLMDVPAACKSDRGSSFASAAVPGAAHVTCFSSAMEGQRDQEEAMAQFLNPSYLSSSPANQDDGLVSSAPFHLSEGVSLVQLLEGNGYGALMAQSCKGERERLSASQDTGLTSDMNPEISSSSGPLQLDDALWSY